MNEIIEKIKEIEIRIEEALWNYEIQEKKELALEIYLDAESKLTALETSTGDSSHTEQQRVLAYCLMRRGNLLRQMGKSEEALAVGECEMIAARNSGKRKRVRRS